MLYSPFKLIGATQSQAFQPFGELGLIMISQHYNVLSPQI